jgi:hypothetical protein
MYEFSSYVGMSHQVFRIASVHGDLHLQKKFQCVCNVSRNSIKLHVET